MPDSPTPPHQRPSQTKIVATIGPACEGPERLRDLIQADASFVPGVLQERDYDAVVGELRKSGLLRKPPPYGRFHVSCPEAP